MSTTIVAHLTALFGDFDNRWLLILGICIGQLDKPGILRFMTLEVSVFVQFTALFLVVG